MRASFPLPNTSKIEEEIMFTRKSKGPALRCPYCGKTSDVGYYDLHPVWVRAIKVCPFCNRRYSVERQVVFLYKKVKGDK